MTPEQARDAMFAIVQAKWDNGYHPIIWPDKPGEPPTTDIPYARVTLRHAGSRQTSFGDIGNRRFNNFGVLIVQVYYPAGSGYEGYSIAHEIVKGFEDARLDVWFRNTRIKEVGASGAFNQINVLTDFTYDEVR